MRYSLLQKKIIPSLDPRPIQSSSSNVCLAVCLCVPSQVIADFAQMVRVLVLCLKIYCISILCIF